MAGGTEPQAVPPGFRFHPTDEELLYYYLRKKVSFEAIDLDVIRDVDLNKLEPWDLKEKCRIGSSAQNEWYFFSHRDKKYPTGTRTNRATTAGFWKATGRDKPIYLTTMGGGAIYSDQGERIGMRKTLVFYIGRAPHGRKTDWIMHEYRLEEIRGGTQDDGWVVCRVFKKKNHGRGTLQPDKSMEDDQEQPRFLKADTVAPPLLTLQDPNYRQKLALKPPYHHHFTVDASMHLPQLLSPDSHIGTSSFAPTESINNAVTNVDMSECSESLLRWITSSCGSGGYRSDHQHQHRHPHAVADYWQVLDKLLASHSNQLGHQSRDYTQRSSASSLSQSKYGAPQIMDAGHGGTSLSTQKFPNQFVGCQTDIAFNFSQ